MNNTIQINPSASNTTDRLWTTLDVCEFLQCSSHNVANLRNVGLPFIKVGQLVRFDPDALKAWLRNQSH